MRYRWFRRYPENSFILTETVNVHAACVLSERPDKGPGNVQRPSSVIVGNRCSANVVGRCYWRDLTRRELSSERFISRLTRTSPRRPQNRIQTTGAYTPAVGLAAFTVWCKEIYCGFFPVRSSKFPINKTRVEIMDRVVVFGFVVTMRKTNALTENDTSKKRAVFFSFVPLRTTENKYVVFRT